MTKANPPSDQENANTLAERWATSTDALTMRFIGNMRRDFLARSLVHHLAWAEQGWAHQISREACEIRARQIVDEIGWPRMIWLEPRVKAWTEYRSTFHKLVNAGDFSRFPPEPRI